jgi:voltage-gated potassium channel
LAGPRSPGRPTPVAAGCNAARIRWARTRPSVVEAACMDERSRRIEERFELPLIVAALLVIPVIVIEESPVGEPWDSIAAVLNWLIWLAFLAEAVTMLAVVPDRRRWLREHPIEIIVVVATPPFLPASLQSIRLLRLLRVLRLFPLLRFRRRLFSEEGLRYAALLALLVVIGGGTAYAGLEDEPTAWDGVCGPSPR